jgi:plasmid stabilization system protein ParE
VAILGRPASSSLISSGERRRTLRGGGVFRSGIRWGAMETEQFWRELASEFSSLASRPGAGYLHAIFDDTSPAEMKELVEAAGERAKDAIHDASAEAIDAAYYHARYAARGAAARNCAVRQGSNLRPRLRRQVRPQTFAMPPTTRQFPEVAYEDRLGMFGKERLPTFGDSVDARGNFADNFRLRRECHRPPRFRT